MPAQLSEVKQLHCSNTDTCSRTEISALKAVLAQLWDSDRDHIRSVILSPACHSESYL